MPDNVLDFELPFASKFLLLAAYVCSRNKPALDRRLFDPSSRAGRRRGAMASDKQVTCRHRSGSCLGNVPKIPELSLSLDDI
jgi:hypothetical protein